VFRPSMMRNAAAAAAVAERAINATGRVPLTEIVIKSPSTRHDKVPRNFADSFDCVPRTGASASAVANEYRPNSIGPLWPSYVRHNKLPCPERRSFAASCFTSVEISAEISRLLFH